MRKLFFVLSIVLLLNGLHFAAIAEETAVISASRVVTSPGETVEVTLSLNGCNGFANLGLEITYDSNALSIIEVSDYVLYATMTCSEQLSSNPYNVTWNSVSDVHHNGDILKIKFVVSENAVNGTYPIYLSYAKGPSGNAVDGINVNYNDNFEPLGLRYLCGSITVSDGAEPTGAYVRVCNAVLAEEIVQVDLELVGCDGFVNLGLEIGYDSEAFVIANVENFVLGASMTCAQSIEENPYNISWNSTGNVNHSGKLATITFNIKDNVKAQIYPVTVDFYKGRNGDAVDGKNVNYDENINPLNLKYINGIIDLGEIIQEESASVCITASNVSNGVVEVDVCLSGCKGFVNLSIEIGYDRSIMTLTKIENYVVGASMTCSEFYETVPYNISWNTATNISPNGNIAKLFFDINENANPGVYPITVDYYKGRNGNAVDGKNVNYDENLNSLGLEYVSSWFEVEPETYALSVESIAATKVTADIYAQAQMEYDGTIVVALYDNLKLVEIAKYDAIEYKRIVFNETGNKIKVMWWDSFTGMNALCGSVETEI